MLKYIQNGLKNDEITWPVTEDGKTITDAKEQADEFNDFFSQIVEKLAENFPTIL